MAYEYRGPRGRSYTNDRQVFDDEEQTHYMEHYTTSQDSQRYCDDFFESYHQEEGTDHNLHESSQTDNHTTCSNQHSYREDIRRQTIDHTVNAQGEISSSEVSGDYIDRRSGDNEQYHSRQNMYRNVQGAMYIEGGRRCHMGTGDIHSDGKGMSVDAWGPGVRGFDRSKEHFRKRNSTKHGDNHSELPNEHAQKHSYRRHGLKYEHRHKQDKLVNKRDYMFDPEHGVRNFDNEGNHEHYVIGQGRELKLSQEEEVKMHSHVYEYGHRKKIPHREDDFAERMTETLSTSQHFTKEESFCDFNDFPKEKQHKPSFPHKTIASSMDCLVKNDSHRHISYKQRKCLLSTPVVEPKDTGLLPTPVDSELHDTVLHSADTVPVPSMRVPVRHSTGLLSTPPDVHLTKADSELHDTVLHSSDTIPVPSMRVPIRHSTGLLSTPPDSSSTNVDFELHDTVLHSADTVPVPSMRVPVRHSTGLLSTPPDLLSTKVGSELLDTVLHSTDTVPVSSMRVPARHSCGLLPTPPDVFSTKVSTGLLPTPTVSPDEDKMFSYPGLLPTPTCKPIENSNTDEDVKPNIYPSKSLLQTHLTSLCRHPSMEREKVDVSIHDNECTLEHDAKSSHDNIQIESESSDIRMVLDIQSSDDEKNQKLQSTDIQDQLTKTLEGMQKTMEILKQKIKSENNSPGEINKKHPPKVKQVIEKEPSNITTVVESEKNVERIPDIPVNFSNKDDPECAEKIDENLNKSEVELIEIETESEMNESYHDSKSLKFETSMEKSENVTKESKVIIPENSKRKQKYAEQPREYRTYREWRLAKERMTKYFYSQSSESEGNDNRKQDSSKDNYTISNQPSNVSDSEIVKEKIEKIREEENVLEKVSHKALNTNTGKKTVNDLYNEKVIEKKQDVVSNEQMKDGEKLRYKTKECRSRHNSTDSMSSHHSKERSTFRHDRSMSRDHDSDRSHKHSRNGHREHSDKNKKSDKEQHHEKSHKHSHKHSSSSNESKHGSSSKENKHSYSSKENKHSSSSRENKHSSSSKEYKRSSSSKEGKHSSNCKESRPSSGSKDSKHSQSSNSSKHQSSPRSEHRSSHKATYHDKSKDIDEKAKEIKNENARFLNVEKVKMNINGKSKEQKYITDTHLNLFEKLAMENVNPSENKSDNDCKGNLFDNFQVENEIIDVVGGISSDEANEKVRHAELEPPKKGVASVCEEKSKVHKLTNDKCMRTAFVKLIDINKSKVKEVTKNKMETVKTRENIFDQLSDEISSVHNTKVLSGLKTVKENASTQSKKSSGTVKSKFLISEDSSSDVDPFVKMSLFLNNKDNKKTVQANMVKKSKVFEKFVFSDDSISESCSDVAPQYSAYKHDRQKKEFVKFLKRVDKTLCWKDIKLLLPRITLKRLDDNDIKRFKSKLKRKSPKPKNVDFKQKETESIVQDEVSSENPAISKDSNSSSIVENKNDKNYRRIIPIKFSSTEQSESSDLERIISQRERRPLIEDSDDNMEGSLGSEDLGCFNVSDISDEDSNTIPSEKIVLGEGSQVDCDLHIDPKSILVEEGICPDIGLKINAPMEIQKPKLMDIANEDSIVEDNPISETVQESEKSESQSMKQGSSKISCSESAGKCCRRRNYSDSSSDSSGDENPCQHRSPTKYQKMQSSKSDENKTGSKNKSNDDSNTMNKNTSPKDSVLGKQLPFHAKHAKRLFKSSKHIKRTSSIMQLDGNADLLVGPPDESSGEEGDVEDNVINIDSDEGCSSSPDLFADLPERLVHISQKPKQIIRSASTSKSVKIKEEDEGNRFQIKDLNCNKEINSSSSSNSYETKEPGEEIMKNDEDKDPVIKDEPDWLKCYTQEPDTIFLSDDDEMIMSVSQPVILVSDDETQDPEADEKPDVRIKHEKPELDLYEVQETTFEYTFENYSSAEDWSDNGSDFEPENMFKSLEKQTNTKTSLVSPERSMSDISLISEDVTVNLHTSLDEKNSENEIEGFESSDGAVLSVDEDELLRSPNFDSDLMTRDEDIAFQGDESKGKRSVDIKSRSESSLNSDFCSSDDEILSTSAFFLESQYMKTLATKKEVILSDNENNETTENPSSKKTVTPYMQETQVDSNITDENTSNSVSVFEKASSICDNENNETTENASSNKTVTLYMQETQVDPNLTDENTSNSVSVFDFHSEYFSDISDSDSKIVNDQTNLKKFSNQRNYGYDTLSDNSDVMIIDSPKDKFDVKTQCEEDLLEDNERNDKKHLIALYEVQTQVDESVDHDDYNRDVDESRADKSYVENVYLAQTQVDQPGPSSLINDIPLKGKETVQNVLQKSRPTIENELFEVETQVDAPVHSNVSREWHCVEAEVDTSSESFSDEDPQMQFYKPEKQQDSNLKNKRLSQDLGIEFESFSDDDNSYQVITEAISSPDSQDSDDLLANIDARPRKQHIEIAMSDTSIDNDAYMKVTQVAPETVSEKEKENIEDQDLYDMDTQIDPADLTNNLESSSSSAIIISEIDEKDEEDHNQTANKDAFLQATQPYLVDDNEEQISNGDIFNMATQNDGSYNFKNDESSDDSISILSVSKDKGSHKVKKQGSLSDDDMYFTATKAKKEDLYNIATQKDTTYFEKSDENTDDDFVTIPKCNTVSASKIEQYDSSVDEDVYLAATQAFDKEISEETEDENFFNIATQKEISTINKRTSIKKCLNNNNAGKDINKNNDLNEKVEQLKTNELSEIDNEKKQFTSDIDKINADDNYLQVTQAYMDDDNEKQEFGADDIYNVATQIDDSDTDMFSLSKSNKKKYNEITHSDSSHDDDVYLAATQANFEDVNEVEDEEDVFNVATQKDIYDLSNDENDINDSYAVKGAVEHKTKNKVSNSDSRCKQFTINFDDENDEAYQMETQCDELPDILQTSDVEELDLLIYSSEDDFCIASSLNKQIPSKSNIINEIDEKSKSGTRSILKRPHAESALGRNVKFDVQFESSAAKKPRFILPERKTISIEPQHLKTSAERKASSLSSTFKPQQFFRPQNTEIEISDATKSDMWLSKKIPTKHFDKIGSKSGKIKKRKRKSDEGDSLQAKMMAARSQLKERAMYNATHPDSIKRVKTAPTATELEDVTLPTGSQIIDQGLPLLNSTGLLLKGTKPTTQSCENLQVSLETSASTAVLSVVTTTLSMATTSTVPTCVQSTPVNPRLHTTVSSTEKNLRNLNVSKDKNQHVSPSQSKDDANRDKGTSRDFRFGDPSVSEADRVHKDKISENTTKQSSSCSKTDKHKRKRTEKEGSSTANVGKENVSKSKDHNSDSKTKDKRSSRERSKSGDSIKDRESKHKHKRREIDRDKHTHKSGEYKKENKRDTDLHKRDSKKENKKYSGKERHNSGKKHEKEYSKSKHSANNKDSAPKVFGKEKSSNSESSGSRHVTSNSIENKTPALSEISEKLERNKLESTTVCTEMSKPIYSSSSTVSLDTAMSSTTSTGSTQVTTGGQTTQTVVNGASVSRNTTTQSLVSFSTLVASVVNSLLVVNGPFASRSTTLPSVINTPSVVSGTSVRSTTTPSNVNISRPVVSGTSVRRSTSIPSIENSLSVVCGTSVSKSTTLPSVVNSPSVVSISFGGRSTTPLSATNFSTSVASGTSVSRSIVRPVSTVKPSVSTHIQSSVLLQKQSSRPPPTSAGSNEVPSMVPICRQPLQPLQPDNMYNTFNSGSILRWDNFLRVILKWSPNWYEEREKMEHTDRHVPPPDVTNDLCGQSNHTLFPLIGKYVSYKEYSEKFMLPLLLHETWESCYSTWRERKGRRKLINHKMMFSHQSQGGDKLMIYTLIGLISVHDKGSGNCVNEGDLVKLIINGDMKVDNNKKRNLDYMMSGFIDKVIYGDFSVDRICAHYKEMGDIRKEISGNCISLKLNVRVRTRSFLPNDKATIQLQSISTIMNTWRQFTGLSSIPRSPLCRDLLYPTANMTYCDKAPAMVSGVQDSYNESQLKAINTAGKIVMLPKEIPRICLLQGPPGTGKSHTIVGIIKHIVKVTQGKCRICLTAPSHAAVDELLRRLNKYNRNIERNSQIKMVRLGKKSSVHEDIQSLCLDNLVQKNLLQAKREELLKQLPKSLLEERKALEKKIIAVRKNIDTAKDQFQKQKHRSDLKKLEKQKEVLESKFTLPKTYKDRQQEREAQDKILLKAHVIAGTLSRIGGGELRSAFHNITGPAFDVVIVDEATQAIELETLIPLQYGVTKLILVGDPEQLPPTVLSQKATENQFNMSLFERLDGHFKSQNINPVILLDRQYRMDPEIAAFPNKYIYDGKIKDDKCVETRSQLPLVPYLLFNVSEGRELFSQGTRSMSNPLEAIFTAELCKFTITNSSVIERVIGIIAPYAKQKTEIVKELEKRHLKNIEVSTVDGFQGREKHVIIMSCVRANQSGTVGFVGDRKRMNVSLTRAKYAMYLVGHFKSLEVSDEWKPLLADARERRKIVDVDQYSMGDAIKKILRK